MNKAELIEVLSEGTAISKAAAGRTLDLLIDSIVKAVAKGDSVTLTGFGTFKSVKRAARKGRNPKTGESIKIAASVAPKFTPGATFKGALNKKKPAKK